MTITVLQTWRGAAVIVIVW